MIIHNKGIVINDKAVDKKTISTASFASPAYFSANIAVVVPAGIPAGTVDTAVTNGGISIKTHPKRTNNGIKIKRIKL